MSTDDEGAQLNNRLQVNPARLQAGTDRSLGERRRSVWRQGIQYGGDLQQLRRRLCLWGRGFMAVQDRRGMTRLKPKLLCWILSRFCPIQVQQKREIWIQTVFGCIFLFSEERRCQHISILDILDWVANLLLLHHLAETTGAVSPLEVQCCITRPNQAGLAAC